MTNKSFAYQRDPTLYESGVIEGRSVISTNSPRVKGKIFFRQNSLGANATRATISPILGMIQGGRPVAVGPSSFNVFVSEINKVAPVLNRDDRNSARLRADERLRDQCGSAALNLSEMWATRRQTADMFASTIGRIAKSYISLKKGKVKDAVKYLGLNYTPSKHKGLKKRTAPEAWLELQYGWKPLLGDIHTMIDQDWGIVTGLVKGTSRIVYNTGKRAKDEYGRECSQLLNQVTRVSSRCIVSFNGSALDAATRVGLTNPALLAWELLPFSFVVDWALPIGTYIERLGVFQSVSISEYSCTTTVITNRNYLMDASGYYKKYRLTPFRRTTQDGRFYSKTKERTLSGFSLNPPPTFKNPLSLGHVANALSLLAVAFKK